MIKDVVENTVRVLLNADCPVIEDGTKVKVLNILDFPATDSQFVTIEDLVNIPLDRHGKPDPIISTVRLHVCTFQEEWIPIG